MRKCVICGAAFASTRGLAEHHSAAHQKEEIRCQSCGRAFSDKQQLARHATKFHTAGLDLSEQVPEVDTIESSLLNRAGDEKKARRRSRGPYRKSHAA